MEQKKMEQKNYVTQLNFEFEGQSRIAYRVTGTRVSLDSVVINWLNGESAESITENFDSLTLEQVYGALAFYLGNREEIDDYLRQSQIEFEKLRQKSWEDIRLNRPQLYHKLMAAKQQRIETAA
jgi:uncharacterized protein (DUF433 family)